MTARSRPVRILHVDDEPGFADLVATYLERENDRFDVDTATSASDGLEQLADTEFDCIVSDYDMPGQDGIEFLDAVRDDYPDLPFILYTGKGSEAVASDAISVGATDYLQKENGSDQYELLANRIQNAVEQYRAQKRVTETEQRLQTIAEHTNDILWKFTADWNELLFINSPYEEIWGRSTDELRANPKSFLKGVHPDDRPTVKDRMEQLSAGNPVDVEYRVNADEDFQRWVWVQGEPVFDEGGDVEKVVGFARDITERKERQRELERKHNRLEALFENAPSPVIASELHDGGSEHRIDDVNDAFEEVFGYESEAVVGKNVADVVVPADKQDRYEEFRKRATAGEPITAEVERVTADGTREFLLHVIPFGSDGDRTDGTYAWYTDISDRKERTRQIERERDRFSAIFEAIPEPVAHARFDEGQPIVKTINSAFTETFGYEPSELEGKSLNGAIVPDESIEEARQIDTAVRNQGMVEQEVERQARDGRRPFLFRGTQFALPDGTLESIGVYIDLTDRQEREQKLAALHDVADDLSSSESVEQVYERTIEASKEILDFDLSVIDIEEGGMLRKQAVSEDVLSEETTDMPVDEGVTGKTYRTGESFLIDDLEAHDDANPQGSYRSAISVPIGDHGVFQAVAEPPGAFDEDDLELAELLISHTESTLGRLTHEQQLERQNDRLEQFASVVSHDLRNPLNVAQGSLELVREECDNEQLVEASDAIDRSLTLVEDLLTLAREGEAVNEVESVALAGVVDGCWQNVETEGATLVSETDRRIRADPGRLKQLLENLFRNAVEHGGADVTVRVGELPDKAGFYVADDGPGIPADEREEVFEPGYSTTRDGTGFGLNIVREIAAAHDWDITITESEAGGARFDITGVDHPV